LRRKPLSYDPAEFLELAEKLVGDADYEEMGRSRTATGRAYYAAFLMVKKKLEELGCSFREVHKLHQDVIERLREKNSATANKLYTLRERRVDADYKMNAEMNVITARNCVRLSRIILNSLSELG
jgi:uncharacterized protein (UPF0332 family)